MPGQEHLGQFSRVDEASNPREFVTLLDDLLLQAGERKRRTYRMMQIHPGDRVLDVGCGAGADVTALGELVGPNGRAVGVDHSNTMIREALARCHDPEVPVRFEQGDAHALPFQDAIFDACRCERLLEHVERPERVVAEMVRVTKPGGRVVAYEPDWGTMAIAAPDMDLTERITSFIARSVRNGWIGRHLRRLFRDADLEQIRIDADVWTITDFELAAHLLRGQLLAGHGLEVGVVAQAELDAWLERLRRTSAEDRFFGSLTFFYATGAKKSASDARRIRQRAAQKIHPQPGPPSPL